MDERENINNLSRAALIERIIANGGAHGIGGSSKSGLIAIIERQEGRA